MRWPTLGFRPTKPTWSMDLCHLGPINCWCYQPKLQANHTQVGLVKDGREPINTRLGHLIPHEDSKQSYVPKQWVIASFQFFA